MNHLGTLGAVLGTVAAFLSILAYLYKGVRYNKARSRAQQGRIDSLFTVAQIQGQRLTTVEQHLSAKDESYNLSTGLMKLEDEAFANYKEHDTKLT